MKKIAFAGAAVVAVAIGAYLTTTQTNSQETTDTATEGAPIVSVTLPETLSAEAQVGKQAFDAGAADVRSALEWKAWDSDYAISPGETSLQCGR